MLLSMILSFSFTHAENQESERLVNALKTFQGQEELKFSFRQENKNLTSGDTIQAHGIVYYQHPNQFRWNYISTPNSIIASDGDMVFMILPDDNHAMIGKFENNAQFWSPINLLTHPETIKSEFDIQMLKSPTDDSTIFRLTPKSQKMNCRYLDVRLPVHQPVLEANLKIIDLAGNENILILENFDLKIPEQTAFIPQIPKSYLTTDFAGNPIVYEANETHGKEKKLE